MPMDVSRTDAYKAIRLATRKAVERWGHARNCVCSQAPSRNIFTGETTPPQHDPRCHKEAK